MDEFPILRPLTAAALALALAACAQQGGTRADATSAGTVVPATETATPPSAGTAVAPAATGNAQPAVGVDADYQALYGATSGSGTSRGSLQPWDPWEGFNRKMHAINNTVDHAMIHPVALTYTRVVPRPVRAGVSNFFRNLGGPSNVLNSLLQGRPSRAGDSLFRFLVNSTFGIGGVFDVATTMHIPDKNNDFGRTFARWGWKNSRYLELPVFGPRTVRDATGMAFDMPLTPLRSSHSLTGQVALRTINVIDIRAQLLSTDALREGAVDDYRLFRDAWWQRRNYQIREEDQDGDANELPDYLKVSPEPTKPD